VSAVVAAECPDGWVVTVEHQSVRAEALQAAAGRVAVGIAAEVASVGVALLEPALRAVG
jgi:hypothetical protein